MQFNQILNIFELTDFAIKLDARACENERNCYVKILELRNQNRGTSRECVG